MLSCTMENTTHASKQPGVADHYIPNDPVVPLHHLCETCASLPERSRLLQRFAQWTPGQFLQKREQIPLCSFSQLEKGYRSKCHLCALIWTRANGRALRPEDGERGDNLVVLSLSPIPWYADGSRHLEEVEQYVLISVRNKQNDGYIEGGNPLHVYLDSGECIHRPHRRRSFLRQICIYRQESRAAEAV